MRYAVAGSAALTAALLLALAPASGQNRTAPAGNAEANAGMKLAALMKGSGVPSPTAAAAQQAFVEEYCADCHNDGVLAGGLDLSAHATTNMGADSEVWEKVARKVRGGMMPPAGSFRPPEADAQLFAASIEQSLDAYSAAQPIVGARALQRLNRTEYGNAVRDVLGYDVDVSSLLPADDTKEGFDNMAEMLGLSAGLIDSYVNAAMAISTGAVGDIKMEPARFTMRPTTQTQGLPLGARGGLIAEYYFPLDAEYTIRVNAPTTGSTTAPSGLSIVTTRPSPPTARVAVVLDGKPIEVANPANFKLTLTAGKHTIGAAMIDLARPSGIDGVYSGAARPGVVSGITIEGPVNATSAGETPSRQRLFVCRPAAAAEEEACARKIFATLATRAYRRPVTVSDPALQPLMAAYSQGRAVGDFEVGVRYGVGRVLVDPRFLLRMEAEPANVRAGQAYKVSDLELASRLSFFLWSSVPDDELLQVAAARRLSRPAELERQVKRMLADPKADALATNFAGQWLTLRNLDTATPIGANFDNTLRAAMRSETEMLFESVLRENKPVTTLLDADYTFLNERLAQHYGVPGVRGSQMRRVTLAPDSPRRGLLGQASVLTVTSSADRTSPVIRGKWVLENILGLPVPKPPPGVETNLDESVHIEGPTTLRTRLEAHRESPACRSCHAVMDPIGFAMEPFDKVGQLRTQDGGLPIDAAGVMVDGTPLNGPDSLRQALVKDSDIFIISVTEKLMSFALGRPIAAYDRPFVRGVVEESAASNYALSDLILNIVESAPFQQRVKSSSGVLAQAGG